MPEDFLNTDAAALTGARARSGGPTPDGAANESHRYAGFWIRAAATLADTLLLVGLSFLIFNPLRRMAGYEAVAFSPIDWIEMVVDFLYTILLTWWTGQTLGKMLTGIRVISARNGGAQGKLTLGQVILREVVGKLLAVIPLGLGYLWVGWSDRKRGWHDMIAKTYVVKVRRSKT
ncbi:RDD family protein [Brevibacillus sp. SYP-B805]|nr:RDD family protein [Brevibacillus sp. SYP-B805]